MKYASVIYRDYVKNSLFMAGAGENNGEFYLPYAKLRERFLTLGIELNTPDINEGREVTFELHINCRRQNPGARAYVYLYENPLIRPLNRNRDALARYVKWFTWDGELLDDSRAIKLFYPNRLENGPKNGPRERPLFCVLVASNKALAVHDLRDQYQARVSIIDWYEQNAPESFHLYGRGWNQPAALSGRWGRIRNQFRKFIARFISAKSPYITWRGPVDDKIELLTRTRFCIAHENCRDLPGYVTEKLFDCFRAGCVPVYIGPKEIADLVPPDCFVDGRNYSSPGLLHAYLSSVSDEEYFRYQQAISNFISSAQAQLFSQTHFVDVITSEIRRDLGLV